MNFSELAAACHTRQDEWFRGLGVTDPPRISLSFRGNELAGEAGEVCNEVKKLERYRLGMVGGKESTLDLEDELGDLIICAQLLANSAGIDLSRAVRNKFNKTSKKHGFITTL